MHDVISEAINSYCALSCDMDNIRVNDKILIKKRR